MAFRNFWNKVLSALTQKAISKLLTVLWRADVFKRRRVKRPMGHSRQVIQYSLLEHKLPPVQQNGQTTVSTSMPPDQNNTSQLSTHNDDPFDFFNVVQGTLSGCELREGTDICGGAKRMRRCGKVGALPQAGYRRLSLIILALLRGIASGK